MPSDSTDAREGGLLQWQYRIYPDGHADRRNLAAHALTTPLFCAGTACLVVAPFSSGALAIAGALGMVAALAAQGRGHRLERVAPVPFRSPLDFVARFFAEQWINFPRFVLSGGFARAWRSAR